MVVVARDGIEPPTPAFQDCRLKDFGRSSHVIFLLGHLRAPGFERLTNVNQTLSNCVRSCVIHVRLYDCPFTFLSRQA